jgi:hypothetical protein
VALAISRFGDATPIADWLGTVARLCAGVLVVRLGYLAIFGATRRTRFGAATVLGCIAAAWIFVGVVLLVNNAARSGAA